METQEKKPRTPAQVAAMEKMRAARAAKQGLPGTPTPRKDALAQNTGVATAVFPICLGPLVTIELCDRLKVAHGCQRKRNSVMDSLDGREWVVQWEGDVLVAEKTGASSHDQQAMGQYERLRQVLASASHRAKAYTEAFEGQKVSDAAELTEASRAEVERIVAAEEEAKSNFERFEAEHPECLRKRLVGEASYHRTLAQRYKGDAEKYDKAVAEWQSKIDEVALKTGKEGRDDHLEEQKHACQAQADEWRSKQDAEEKAVAKLDKEVSGLPVFTAVSERLEVRPGQAVAFS